jgi:hypothetical protein
MKSKDLENYEFVLRALESYKGDNLERARYAFKGCTPEQMRQEYGQSGQTRAQILEGYEHDRQKWQDAYDWLIRLSPKEKP